MRNSKTAYIPLVTTKSHIASNILTLIQNVDSMNSKNSSETRCGQSITVVHLPKCLLFRLKSGEKEKTKPNDPINL